MKVVAIPDIHLKPRIFDYAEKILKSGQADRAVCLMDIPDDWEMEKQIDAYKETYDRAISFAKDYPDTLWCYGNHDISYLWEQLESGYSFYAEKTVITKLNELKNTLKDKSYLAFIHRIDNVLFTHGGLITDFVCTLNEKLVNADIDEVITAINNASKNLLWDNDSPLWFRPQYGDIEIFRNETYIQVVGHTPVKEIYEKNGVISTDVFSTYNDGTQIGESAFVVIDSESKKYEKIYV